MLKHVPNALTLLRLVLAPVVVWFFWQGVAGSMNPPPQPYTYQEPAAAAAFTQYLNSVAFDLTMAATLFILAALTDAFDGMAARAFNAHSKFGRLIDPIADKAIVGLPLIIIAFAMWFSGYPLWPVVAIASAVIIIRDVSMTLVRLNAKDGEGARVSNLAKIKTALELVIVGSLLVVTALGAHLQAQFSVDNPGMIFVPFYAATFEWVWLIALVVTAALSAWTAWQYLRPKRTA